MPKHLPAKTPKRTTTYRQRKQPARGNIRNAERQRRAAQNIAKGMQVEPALVQAGYSESYAKSLGYLAIKKPYFQSILTEAVERALKRKNKQFDDIIQPYIDALNAPLIVKSQTEGIACIAKDPDTQEILPDHAIRMGAADRLVKLYGGEEKVSPPPASTPQPSFNPSNWDEADWEAFKKLYQKSQQANTVIDGQSSGT